MRFGSGESLRPASEIVVAGALLALVVHFTLSCQNQAEAPASNVAAMVVDSVASEDGVVIYYDVRGSGERTLVFVHCWSCDRSYWQRQVEEFTDVYRVVTIDLAGHGQSGLAGLDVPEDAPLPG